MKIRMMILGIFVASAAVFAYSPATSAIDVGINNDGAACTSNGTDNAVCAGSGDTVNSTAETVINTLIYLLDIICVLVIIIAGFMYTVSGGASATVTKAKDAILYAVIGLVVAIVAFSVVNFVLGQF